MIARSSSEGRQLDDLSRALGAIEQQASTIAKTQGEDRIASAQYRTEIRSEMQTLVEEVAKIGTAATAAKEAFERIQPVVAVLEQHRLMAIGAGRLAVWLARSGYAVAGAVGAFLLSIIEKHWH